MVSVAVISVQRGAGGGLHTTRDARHLKRLVTQADARRGRVLQTGDVINPFLHTVLFQAAGRAALRGAGIAAGEEIAGGDVRQDVAHVRGIVRVEAGTQILRSAVAIVQRLGQVGIVVQNLLGKGAALRGGLGGFQAVGHLAVDRIFEGAPASEAAGIGDLLAANHLRVALQHDVVGVDLLHVVIFLGGVVISLAVVSGGQGKRRLNDRPENLIHGQRELLGGFNLILSWRFLVGALLGFIAIIGFFINTRRDVGGYVSLSGIRGFRAFDGLVIDLRHIEGRIRRRLRRDFGFLAVLVLILRGVAVLVGGIVYGFIFFIGFVDEIILAVIVEVILVEIIIVIIK